MNPNIVVLATHNQGKITELSKLLAPLGVTLRGLDSFPDIQEIEETGNTFIENARLKAHAVCTATGYAAIADDSGLEVDALGGAPGIFSARYSAHPGLPATDRRNIEKLLQDLSRFPEQKRTARFRCTIIAVSPDGAELAAQGTWEGSITDIPSGSGGFGYDPVFFDRELGCTAAQMPPEIKNARSHRGKAVAELLRLWPDFMHRHITS